MLHYSWDFELKCILVCLLTYWFEFHYDSISILDDLVYPPAEFWFLVVSVRYFKLFCLYRVWFFGKLEGNPVCILILPPYLYFSSFHIDYCFPDYIGFHHIIFYWRDSHLWFRMDIHNLLKDSCIPSIIIHFFIYTIEDVLDGVFLHMSVC